MKNPDYQAASAAAQVAGADIVLDLSGALYIPGPEALVVSDLHFEKASSFARRRQFVPPYDTSVTLTALERAVRDYAPKMVVCLGDSFHDPFCAERLLPEAIARFAALAQGRDWIWVAGNHDPEIPHMLAGERVEEVCIGPLSLRHIPQKGEAGQGEIAGHLHPVGRILRRGRMVRRPCFATDGSRLIMPAFGALTGGLNLGNPAFKGLFDMSSLTAWMIGAEQLHAVHAQGLC
jgi:DNA ligase-associated metallophosphoesterase